MDKFTEWEDILAICERNREADRFCRRNCSCSGPSYSNYGPDFEDRDRPKGGKPVRGRCGFMGWVKD